MQFSLFQLNNYKTSLKNILELVLKQNEKNKEEVKQIDIDAIEPEFKVGFNILEIYKLYRECFDEVFSEFVTEFR